MSDTEWTVTYEVFRQKGAERPHFDRFVLQVDPDEYVLDGVERVWAFHDRSLTFRHACHHSVCGACGMRVNGREKLSCITRIRDVVADGGTIRVEPLRNLPVVGDLVVDMAPLYSAMERVGFRQVAPLRVAPDTAASGIGPDTAADEGFRLVDCIECGLCLSACPVAATDPHYLGPAVLAALHHDAAHADGAGLGLADGGEGVWRCHSAFECGAVCPSFVAPEERVMDARRQIVGQRLVGLFRPRKEKRG